LKPVPPGTYAIVESAKEVKAPKESKKNISELFVPIVKEVHEMPKEGGRFKFFLADVEAFNEPITVIPDIGGSANGYFMVRRRSEWREEFVKWLRRPYDPFEDFSDNDEEDYVDDLEGEGDSEEEDMEIKSKED